MSNNNNSKFPPFLEECNFKGNTYEVRFTCEDLSYEMTQSSMSVPYNVDSVWGLEVVTINGRDTSLELDLTDIPSEWVLSTVKSLEKEALDIDLAVEGNYMVDRSCEDDDLWGRV